MSIPPDASEHRSGDWPEGWDVRQRPALYAAAGTIVVLLAGLVAAGYFYNRDLKPMTYQSPAALPSPALDTWVQAAGSDPYRAAAPTRVDPDLIAAKRRVLARGIPGWTRQP